VWSCSRLLVWVDEAPRASSEDTSNRDSVGDHCSWRSAGVGRHKALVWVKPVVIGSHHMNVLATQSGTGSCKSSNVPVPFSEVPRWGEMGRLVRTCSRLSPRTVPTQGGLGLIVAYGSLARELAGGVPARPRSGEVLPMSGNRAPWAGTVCGEP
jgi:hypothetical protein